MRLDDYWGVGPKTRELLSDEMGESEAVEAIESADVRALTAAGLPRGRATRIVRRAKGGKGLDVLATRDSLDVYKSLLDTVSGFAVTDNAADRISVLTPFLSSDEADERLDEVFEAYASWESLEDGTRDEVLDAFDEYDESGSERGAVEAAVRLKDAVDAEGAFSRLGELDDDALDEAVELLGYVDGDVEGADDELDELRGALGRVEELEDSALDVVERIRSADVRGAEELRDEFVDYVVNETGVTYDRLDGALASDPADATDFVTRSLRSLYSGLESDVEERESEIREELDERLSEVRDDVDDAVETVDRLAFLVSLARFADEFGLTRPEFVEDGVAVEGARNLGLVAAGEDVQPVTYSVGEHNGDVADVPNGDRVSVLTGANSGGKTTLLETVCQVVLLAQMGLPVPAERAEVAVFDSVVFHRRHASFNAGVLESTLRSIVPPLTRSGRTLMLVDEFEAITEPGSAADLLHGLVTLTVERGALGVFVTHLADDLAPLPDAARIDGIFAEGLDDELELRVDYQPRFDTVGRSTPEFIVSRLIADSGDSNERMGFETLANAVGAESVQRTLDEI